MRWFEAALLVSVCGCTADSVASPETSGGSSAAGKTAVVTAGTLSTSPGQLGPVTSTAGTWGGAGRSATGIPTTPQAGAQGTVGIPNNTVVPTAGKPAPAGAGATQAPIPTQPVPGGPATPLDPSVKQPAADKLPKATEACPALADGTVTVAGSKVVIWVGSKPGPAYFYFHGTGTAPSEINQGLPGAATGVKTNGGLAASWDTSNNKGSNTGTIWYTGDLEGMDQLVACGVEKGIIDTGRIHVSGFSAGGLETGAAVFGRSNYVASAIVYSGGKPFGAGALQDPSNVPAVLGAHGAKGSDMLGLDFHDGTISLESEIVKLGGFAIDCDDEGDHIGGWFKRAGVGGKAMQFLADHPYNTRPSPYESALPAGFPTYCKVVE